MKLDLTLRFKVFMLAVLFIVAGQTVYSLRNIDAFRRTYVHTLVERCEQLAHLLKGDIEYVLGLNIALNKLTNMEGTLREVLDAIPELKRIEITDPDMQVLYSAAKDQGSEEPALSPKEVELSGVSSPGSGKANVSGRAASVLPLYAPGREEAGSPVGFIHMYLSEEVVAARSREILLDMVTTILVSLLISFELLTFFSGYAMSSPLQKVTRDLEKAGRDGVCMPERRALFMGEIAEIREHCNRVLDRVFRRHASLWSLGEAWTLQERSLRTTFQDHLHSVERLDEPVVGWNEGVSGAEIEMDRMACGEPEPSVYLRRAVLEWTLALKRLVGAMGAVTMRFEAIERVRCSFRWALDPLTRRGRQEVLPHAEAQERTPPAYLRLIVFFFVMADGFTLSFFPMFVDSLYEPVAGLSRQMILGLPISAYMLCFALSMPLTGTWCDRVGWRKPLIAGILVNTIGFLLTALSQDILQLILFRCLTAAGFGMAYLACQQFVVDNTTVQDRTSGMAGFLAAFFSGDICGTVVGGMLADRIGYRNVFLVSALLSFLSLGVAIWLFRHVTPFGRGEKRAPFSVRDLFRVIGDREFFVVTFLQAIPSKIVLIGFLYYLVPLYLKHLEVSQSSIGRVLMGYSVMLVFVGPPVSKALPSKTRKWVQVLAGGVITGAAMMSFYQAPGLHALILLVVLLGLAHTLSVSAQASLVAETPAIRRLGTGVGMGLFRFWERAGNVSGPLLVGYLIHRQGFEGAVYLLGIGSLVCSLLYALFLAPWKRNAGRDV